MKLRHLLPLILMLAPLALTAQSYTVTAIHFKTLRTLSEAEVLAATGLKTGESITDAGLDKAQARLADSGAFANVSYSYTGQDNNIEVEFQVEEMERPYPCRFDNFVWLSDDELIAYLQSKIPLFHGKTSPNQENLNQIMRLLDEWLRDHQIQGATEMQLHTPWQGWAVDAVNFDVSGVNIPIAEVNLGPTPSLKDDERKQLLTLLRKGMYSHSYVDKVVSLMYWHKGYNRVEVLQRKAELKGNAAAPSVALTLEVVEHLPYKLGAITFDGNTAIREEDVTGGFAKVKGKPLPYDSLLNWLAGLQSIYHHNGYNKMTLSVEPHYDDASATVNYTVHINEGPRKLNPSAQGQAAQQP